jgi:hypothetical protein
MGYDGEFSASVQYNDFKGTAAADRAGQHDIYDLLELKGLSTDNEFLLSIQFYSAEHDFVRCVVLLLENADTYEDVQKAIENTPDPIPVKEVHLDLTPAEFLKLFKRFAVVLNPGGLSLQGRKFIVD